MPVVRLPKDDVLYILKDLALPSKSTNGLILAKELAEKKIERLAPELRKLKLFPDAKKKEIYEQLVDGGEIAELKTDTVPILVQAKLDAEYQSELAAVTTKLNRLQELVDNVPIELELREADIPHKIDEFGKVY